jgi:hypothetical protein
MSGGGAAKSEETPLLQQRNDEAKSDEEKTSADVAAAGVPAADDCVRCDQCSNNKIMHPTVVTCPCCHAALSSANSESACSERCPERSHNVPDCDDDEQCTLHSNHLDECLFHHASEATRHAKAKMFNSLKMEYKQVLQENAALKQENAALKLELARLSGDSR